MVDRFSGEHVRGPGAAFRQAAGVALSVLLAACLQDGGGPGALAGPSTLALSIRLSATPDVLPADGMSEAIIAVAASGPDGAPAGNLRLRVRIVEGSTAHDLGRLSQRSVVTDAAGRAALAYRAPAPAGNPAGEVDSGRVIMLVVTPVMDDFSDAIERRVRIRLVPAGAVMPPFEVRPGFEVTPAAPGVLDQVRFSAADCPAGALSPTGCTHDPSGLAAAYRWDFGDGAHASGQQLAHVYSRAGTYMVRLTVNDSFGRSADATGTVTIAAGIPPDASIAVSPIPAVAGAEVFFDASASTAAEGRRIVSHAWNFGDGSTGTGVTTSHVYESASTYTVVLNATDNAGSVGTVSTTVDVVDPVPIVVVDISPQAPAAGQRVFFSAEVSALAGGGRIVRYRWDFGDGSQSDGGATASHVYAMAGQFIVSLTVTDSGNRSGRATVRVVVE